MTTYYMIANEDFIEKLCENKEKPELACDGKCVFAKMIAEQQSDTNQLPFEFLKPYHIPLYYQSTTGFFLLFIPTTSVLMGIKQQLYTSLTIDTEVQPPELVA